jgi:hypothetical protein
MEQSEIYIKHYINARNVFIDLLYTMIISTLIAAFLTLTGITKSFVMNLIVSQSFGISICSIIMFLRWIFKPEKMVSVAFIVMIGIASGTLIGLQIGSFVLQQFFSIILKQQEISSLRAYILAITFGIILSYFFYSKSRLRVTEEEIQ